MVASKRKAVPERRVAVGADVPAPIVAALRTACLALPEVHEEPAWSGLRWKIRARSFAHVLEVESGPPTARADFTVMMFRSNPPERDVLLASGHPFFKPGWGTNVVGMVIDDAFDPEELAELVTESYCILAPKKLVALVDRPPAPEDDDGMAPPDL